MSDNQVDWRTVLQAAAQSEPDKLAFRFTAKDDGVTADATYGELDRRARAIGAQLTHLGLAGRPALLLYPPGLDYVEAFFGCLYSGVIAVPAYPPTGQPRSTQRLARIALDCAATAALTTPAGVAHLTARMSALPEVADLAVIGTAADTDDTEVVVLMARDLDHLRQTHSRYFRTARQLFQAASRLAIA